MDKFKNRSLKQGVDLFSLGDQIDTEFQTFQDLILKTIHSSSLLSKKDWKKLRENYKKRYELLKQPSKYPNFGSDCIIDYIFRSKGEASTSEKNKVIDAFNNLTESIQKNDIYRKFKHKINKKIKEIFIVDASPNQKQTTFKNSLNELNFLNYLLNCENIDLIDIERKLPNDNDCDFVIYHKDNHETIGLELETVQFFDGTKSQTSTEIKNFLENRALRKWNEKIKDMIEIPNLDNFKIVLLVEENQTMGLVDFPLSFNENMLVMSTECYYDVGWRLRIVDTFTHIERLKRDDSSFFSLNLTN